MPDETPDEQVPSHWVVIAAAVTPLMAAAMRMRAKENERSLSGEIRVALGEHLGWIVDGQKEGKRGGE